jgi:putative lipoprotein
MRVLRAHDLMLTVCLAAFGGVVLPANASAAESDALGPDKALHYTVSVGLTLGASLALDVAGVDEPAVLPLSIGFALGLGIGKEAFDAVRGNSFSAADLTWDVLGIATGVLIHVLLRALFAPDFEPDRALAGERRRNRGRGRAVTAPAESLHFFFVVK